MFFDTYSISIWDNHKLRIDGFTRPSASLVAVEETVVDDADIDDGDDDSLVHTFCKCSPHWALCGCDLNGGEVDDIDPADECVVCLDLEKFACPRCGQPIDA